MKWAIFMRREQSDDDVLLTDGAWTSPRAVIQRPDLGFVPRLFDSKGLAASYKKDRYCNDRRTFVAEWAPKWASNG